MSEASSDQGYKTVFTIGHSNHSMSAFLELLRQHDIDVLVDVRSSPFAKYSTQFDQDNLRSAISNVGPKYLFLGRELGGKPKDESYYDEEGHVLYWKISASELFKQGMKRLLNGISSYRIALMCAEENPTSCHRRLLITRVLTESGAHVTHIRGDGSLQTEEELILALEPPAQQMNLFNDLQQADDWQSQRSVMRRRSKQA
jgi:uncharacterized protein (DUF488 family)